MILLDRRAQRRLRTVLPPLAFLSLVGYFSWNAISGERGLLAQRRLKADLVAARADQAKVQAELVYWRRRVDSLSGAALDPDMLDERVRRMLNLADPADLVVPLKLAPPP